VSLLLAINYRRCYVIDENPEQGFITSVNDTGDNLPGVTTTPAIIFCQQRHWRRWL
jgi:hypothetical protein